MYNVFSFVGYNLKRLFSTPRPYIAFMLVFSVMQLGLGGCRNYAEETSQAFQAVEFYVFSHNSSSFLLYYTLGLVLILGDAPFLKEGMSLRLIRTNRIQWLLGQCVSCVVICIIYLVVIELLFLLLLCGHITFENEWSQGITLAAQLGNGIIINTEMAIGFSMSILQMGSPYLVFGVTFLFNLLLYSFFSMLLIACNLRFRNGVGIFIVLSLIGLKFLLNYVFSSTLLSYLSPCNVACLDGKTLTIFTFLYTMMFFLVLSYILVLLAFHSARNADLLKGDYA